MLHTIQALIITFTLTAFTFADVSKTISPEPFIVKPPDAVVAEPAPENCENVKASVPIVPLLVVNTQPLLPYNVPFSIKVIVE